ncbi:hypothetical protein [Pseudomonas petrae]|uniref:hypothetical protein n=1 Tax=Pseudomonas petrae TaxID=2912190 RepID=UPI001F36AF81|nr:hypothetical protein [Pseudomonas petrae]MCF7558874.1 hypothetical protein [Pseudomonas petrae]
MSCDSELKVLCQVVGQRFESVHDAEQALEQFEQLTTPAVALELIAEINRHQGLYDHMKSMREAHGYESWTEVLVVAEKLKADNDLLRAAVQFAVEQFEVQTSADGSGHADIARAVLRIAGSAMGQEVRHG